MINGDKNVSTKAQVKAMLGEASRCYRARLRQWLLISLASAVIPLALSSLFLYLCARTFMQPAYYPVIFLVAVLIVFPVLVVSVISLDRFAVNLAKNQLRGQVVALSDSRSIMRQLRQTLTEYRPIWQPVVIGFYIVIGGDLVLALLLPIFSMMSAGMLYYALLFLFVYIAPAVWVYKTTQKIRERIEELPGDKQDLPRGTADGEAQPCPLTPYFNAMILRALPMWFLWTAITVLLITQPLAHMVLSNTPDLQSAARHETLFMMLAPFPFPAVPSVTLAGIVVGLAWNIPYFALARVIAARTNMEK